MDSTSLSFIDIKLAVASLYTNNMLIDSSLTTTELHFFYSYLNVIVSLSLKSFYACAKQINHRLSFHSVSLKLYFLMR